MAASNQPIRARGFADFTLQEPELRGGNRHWLMRARNFSVEWVEFGGDGAFEFASDFEALLLGVQGDVCVGPATTVPADAIAIVPAGQHAVRGLVGARCVLIASQRGDLAGRRVLHGAAYEQPDPRLVATGRPFRRARAAEGIEVLSYAQIMASPDKPRLKMLQTETLSINLVDYRGPRDRTALSPHSHADFEQASLALTGDFMHHLRTPWGSDANRWREDEHLKAPSPSMVVVPAEVIHTTEGLGDSRHVLIDIFSPPRFDFIANGWVFNAGNYVRQEGAAA